jgi:putative tryptophan/tyrosine transport system substrate-binding protein
MKRRMFFALLGGIAVTALASPAQTQRLPIIARLIPGSGEIPEVEAAFASGLSAMGYADGKNVEAEYRWTEGRDELASAKAAELVELKPAVIVTGGNVLALAAKRTTSTIPIVFNVGSDPVQLGLAASFNHPGGNATGVATLTGPLTVKRLGLLAELLPHRSTIGVLVNPDNQDVLPDVEHAARSIGQTIQIIKLKAANSEALESAFAQLAHDRAGGILVANDAFFFAQRAQIVALAHRYSLPAIYEWPNYPSLGGLMSYGPSLPAIYRVMGMYVGRILQGAKPGDLPIEQPTKFELVMNLESAKALGLTVPQSLLARADKVIE